MTVSQQFLGKLVNVVVDRALGSRHPDNPKLRYPVNYGFIPGTTSGDGEELDAYVLGVNTATERFTGRCVAVLRRLEEDDDKLIVAADGTSLTEEEILEAVDFQERFFTVELIRE